jgi:transposase
VWRLEIKAELRRLVCPTHGVRTEGVGFARAGSRFSADFEDLVGWLATTMDKTAIRRLVRIDWDTVGRIVSRVMDDSLDPDRLEGLFNMGIDDVSWRRHHHYLTLISNHDAGKFVWGAPGRDTATADSFFEQLGESRSGKVKAVSMDMSAAYANSVTAHATRAVICYDPYHVVALATTALDRVRRGVWNDLRALPDKTAAHKFKGARWCLLKNPPT